MTMFNRQPQDSMPPDPTPAQDGEAALREQMLALITNSCIMMREQHAILFDTADGMRADLLNRGWPRQMADAMVFTWTQRNIMVLTPVPGEGGDE